MRFPERTIRRWGKLAYVIEWCAMIVHYVGITIFVVITLFQVRGFLESGIWPWMAMRIVFVDHLHLSLLTDPSGWYQSPTDWRGLRDVLWFVMERVPVSLLFLIIGRYLAFGMLWAVDHLLPERVVEHRTGKTDAKKQMFINIK